MMALVKITMVVLLKPCLKTHPLFILINLIITRKSLKPPCLRIRNRGSKIRLFITRIKMTLTSKITLITALAQIKLITNKMETTTILT